MASAPKEPAVDNREPSIRRDFFASLVVFMVALPLCIAIASACELPPELGIVTGIVGGLIVGPIAGSPLQVSGPAAGLIVLVLDFLILRKGMFTAGETGLSHVAALGIAVFVGGLLQLVMAAARLGPLFRSVAPAVVLGMLAGIGAVIVAKQVHVMIDDKPAQSVLDNLVSIPKAAYKAIVDPDPDPPHHTAAVAAGLVTMFCLIVWKPLAPKRVSFIPAALVAVVAGTLVAEAIDLKVIRVDIRDNLISNVTWMTPDTFWAGVREASIWKMAVAIAFIASAETLLCATAVDQMHRGPRTNYDRELGAQGVGNALCGILGALPMTGVIVRSSANVTAGATSRWSATMHGAWLLLFVVALPFVLELIPAACLAAVLVYTGVKLVNHKAAIGLWKTSKGEFAIYLATLLGVVFTDLLTGVILGVVLSLLKLVYMVSHLQVYPISDSERREITLGLSGAATFISLPRLTDALDRIPPGWSVHVDLDGLTFIDHACLHALTEWDKQHQKTGGKLYLDHDGVESRFSPAPSNNGPAKKPAPVGEALAQN